MKLKRIRKIDILGVEHKVRHTDTGEKGGWYDAGEKRIEIDRTVTDEWLYLETLLHESFHGVFQITGIHQDISLVQEHVITDSIISFLKKNFEIKLRRK